MNNIIKKIFAFKASIVGALLPRLSSGFGVARTYAGSLPLGAISGIAVVAVVSLVLISEASLPGGFLYPVKLGINEQIRGAVALGVAANVQWDIHRAERRLQEAARLAQKGAVNPDIRAKLEADFKGASNRAQRTIEQIHASGDLHTALNLTVELAVMLRAHESALVKIEEQGAAQRAVVSIVRQELQEELQETEQVKTFMEAEAALLQGGSPALSPSVSPTPAPKPRL